MSLARRLTGSEAVSTPRCILGYWLDEADDPDEREAIRAAVERKTKRKWSADALATELTGAGMPVSASTIRNHRRGQCACQRRTS